MSKGIAQPPIEAALGAPLQVNEDDDIVVVEIRGRGGSKVELKRFKRNDGKTENR
jgi:hypothetical protein